jgi:glycosyltransferase involved in cell wall biosynthesis
VTQSAVIRPYPSRAAKLQASGIPAQMLRFGGPLDVWSSRRLRLAASAWRPDIVLGWMNRACARLPRGPWVNVGRLGGYYDLKYYRRCHHLICNTPDIADYVVREGKPAAQVHYIPNFCPVAPGPAVHPDAIRTPVGVPVLLVLARLQPAKGIDLAIRALADIPDAVLWIAGDGPLVRDLQQLARDVGVTARVRFLGWRDDRSALLKAATVCLVPSRHEPFGNVVVNAWAHGVPLVAARSQGPGYLIRDGQDGLLVPVDDAPALAAAVRRVIDDRALAGHLAAEGTMRAAAEFSEAAVVRRYLEVFRAIAP